MTITDLSMPGDGTAAPPVEGGPSPEAPGVTILGTTVQEVPGTEEPPGPGPEGPEGPGEVPGPGPTGPVIDDDGQIGDPGPEQGAQTAQQQTITAEVPVAQSAAGISSAAPAFEGVARPMGAFFGDLAPGFDGMENVGEAVSGGFDLGLVGDTFGQSWPEELLGGIDVDGSALLDLIEDLIDAADDALTELGQKLSSVAPTGPSGP